jgi:WD40 repeat protein
MTEDAARCSVAVLGEGDSMAGRFVIAFVALWLGAFQAAAGEKAAIFPQLGHSGAVEAVAFSHDGALLVSAGSDDTIIFWDVASGRELRRLTGHTGSVNAIAFAPNGKTLASASSDKTIRLWDVSTGRALRVFQGKVAFSAVVFSPDGKVLASAGSAYSSSGGVLISAQRWDAESGHALPAPSENLLSTAFAANGKTFATLDWKGAATLWDVASGRKLRVLSGFGNQIGAMAFSPDSKLLVSQTFNEGIKLWDVSSGRMLRAMANSDQSTAFLGFTADDAHLFSRGDHNSIAVWDVAAGTAERVLSTNSNYGDSGFLCMSASPDGKSVAAGNQDASITIWDSAHGLVLKTLARHSGFVRSVAFSSDSKLLGVGDADGALLWNAALGEQSRDLTGQSADGAHDTRSIAFTPDGKLIATSGFPGVQLWNATSGTSVRTLEAEPDAMAVSPDGQSLAVYGPDNTIQLWDTTGGKVAHTLTMNVAGLAGQPGVAVSYLCMTLCRAGPSNGCGASLAFSPDGKLLAQGSMLVSSRDNKFIRLFDIASGQELRELSGNFFEACSVAFSPGGKMLVTGTSDGSKLWDVASGRELSTLKDSAKSSFVAFSGDGKFIVSGDGNNSFGIWDVASGRKLRSFVGHSGLVTSAAFSSDGKVIVSGSDDGTTRIWDAATAKERVALIGFDDGSSVAFTPEGFFDSSSEQAEDNLAFPRFARTSTGRTS